MTGEYGDVQAQTVSGWHERLQTLMISYKPEDKWNTDETVCFSRQGLTSIAFTLVIIELISKQTKMVIL